jgi:hypothetical protein
MYFMLQKSVATLLKLNFHSLYFLRFTTLLLVFRKFLETNRDFILKTIPMFVKLLPLPINHEHRECIVKPPLNHSHVNYQLYSYVVTAVAASWPTYCCLPAATVSQTVNGCSMTSARQHGATVCPAGWCEDPNSSQNCQLYLSAYYPPKFQVFPENPRVCSLHHRIQRVS